MVNKEQYIHVGTDEAHERYTKDIILHNMVEQVYVEMEQAMKIPDLLGKTVLVTENQFSEVNQILKDLSAKMNMEKPDMYVFEDFFYGIESYGMKNFWIEISAKTIRDFKKAELRFLIARELYKIKSNVTYQTMFMNQMRNIYASVPFTGNTMEKVSRVNFNHWCRLENYTADNFAYLICGDVNTSIKTIVTMVLNSKSLAEELNIASFIRQASAINKLDNIVSNYTKSDETLPYAPLRIESLLAYTVSRRGMKARREMAQC
jgi:hypothetical protein